MREAENKQPLAWETTGTYPIVGLMFGSKLSSTNLQTILDFPTPVSCRGKIKLMLSKRGQKQLLEVWSQQLKHIIWLRNMSLFLFVVCCFFFLLMLRTIRTHAVKIDKDILKTYKPMKRMWAIMLLQQYKWVAVKMMAYALVIVKIRRAWMPSCERCVNNSRSNSSDGNLDG